MGFMSANEKEPKTIEAAPARGGPLLPGRLLAWLAGGLAASAAAGWLAAQVATLRAPLIVFPLILGVVLGLALAGLARLLDFGHRPSLLTGSAALLLVAIGALHYEGYRQHRRAYERAKAEQSDLKNAEALFGDVAPPESFGAFLVQEAQRGRTLFGSVTARGAWAWVSWGADALLALAGTLLVVVPAARQPYCRGCKSWYRTVRSGALSAEAVRRLREGAGLDLPAEVGEARYAMSTCRAGDGPTGLRVSWSARRSEGLPSGRRQFWLDREGRRRVEDLLEGPAETGDEATAKMPTGETTQ